MSNGTTELRPEIVRERLRVVVEKYRGQLSADERRLHLAMLEYERSCWVGRMPHAA